MGYRIETRTFEELEGKLKLPNFQRALVWSNNQKQEFFNTLKDGYPFGSILLYEYENDNKFSLIDGLQRYSTMEDFKEHPTNYIEFDEYTQKVANLHINASERTMTEIKNYAEDILLKIIDQHIISPGKTRATYLAKKMADEFPVLDDPTIREEITEIQHEVMNFFDSQLNISKVKIPCIIFEGEETDLAEVFQRLNSGGKKLSKYQVFAAHWDKYDFSLNKDKYSNQILENVIDRYESLNNERGILIEDFNPQEMKETRKINLSEFCYGLGKIIADSLEVFFDKVTEDICNELGFQTMLIVFEIPTSKMNTLPNKYKFLKNPNSIEDLVIKIMDIYKVINNKFDDNFNISVLTRKKKHETKSFTRLQILSFFASLWQVSYFIEADDNKNSMIIKSCKSYKNNRKNVLNNLISHSIYDIVRSYWSGTGDKKLMDIYINKNNKYAKPLQKDIFKNELLRWNEDNIHKSNVNIQSDEKMIVSFLANKSKSFYESLNDNLDYEHIFSRKLYNTHKKNYSIPAGSLGNIMLLDEEINRKKKEKFLYEIIDLEKLNDPNSKENNYIELSFYPEKRVIDQVELDIVQNNYESLIKMIKNRGDVMINKLVEILYD